MLALAACSCAVAVDWDGLRRGTSSAYEAAVMANTPYAFFPLHDAPGTTNPVNLGPEGVQGIVMGGVTFNGSSASFDGTGYIDLGADYSFSGSKGLAPYTIEAWIAPSDDAPLMIQTILSEGTETSGGELNGYNLTVGPSEFGRGAGMSSCGVNFMIPSGGYHFAGVYDGMNSYVFINGVSAGASSCGSGNNPPLAQECGASLLVGADPNMQNFFVGQISELAIYQTTLTPSQILNHYNAGMSGP
jgi:hypothetical protein